MKLVFAAAAKADLLQIGDRIAKDSPVRSLSFVDDLEQRCHRPTSMPEAYQLIPGFEDRGVRRVPYGNYLIFYRVIEDAIEVLHVLHGARDYEAILFPDG
jgi:plasmid stabilization system protein ParE